MEFFNDNQFDEHSQKPMIVIIGTESTNPQAKRKREVGLRLHTKIT